MSARGLPLEDLVAEGNLGLIRAAEDFDGGMGTRFATYASFWITQSIQHGLARQGDAALRLPVYVRVLLRKWTRAAAVLADRLGRAPTQEEVAGELGLPEKKRRIVVQALLISRLKATNGFGGDGGDALGGILDRAG